MSGMWVLLKTVLFYSANLFIVLPESEGELLSITTCEDPKTIDNHKLVTPTTTTRSFVDYLGR